MKIALVGDVSDEVTSLMNQEFCTSREHLLADSLLFLDTANPVPKCPRNKVFKSDCIDHYNISNFVSGCTSAEALLRSLEFLSYGDWVVVPHSNLRLLGSIELVEFFRRSVGKSRQLVGGGNLIQTFPASENARHQVLKSVIAQSVASIVRMSDVNQIMARNQIISGPFGLNLCQGDVASWRMSLERCGCIRNQNVSLLYAIITIWAYRNGKAVKYYDF